MEQLDLFLLQSPLESGKGSDKPCTCTQEIATPRAELLQPSHLPLSLYSLWRGNCVSVCVLPAAKDLVICVWLT